MQMTYMVDALPPRLVIGRQTETGVEMMQFDCTAWLSIWPDMEVSVWPMRPGEIAAYPAIVERAGNIITWTITDVDTAVDGEGSVEVMGMADGKRKLSARAATHILASSLGNTQERPEGAKPWVDEVLDAAKRAETAAAKSEQAVVNPPKIGANGNWWLWSFEAAVYVDSGHPAAGINATVADAGKLLYVDDGGHIATLRLGAGLEIRDGTLYVTAAAADNVEFIAQDNGDIMLAGIVFEALDDGSVLLDRAAFTVVESGDVQIG